MRLTKKSKKQAKRRIKSITCLYISLKFEDVRGPESIVSTEEEKKRMPKKKKTELNKKLQRKESLSS